MGGDVVGCDGRVGLQGLVAGVEVCEGRGVAAHEGADGEEGVVAGEGVHGWMLCRSNQEMSGCSKYGFVAVNLVYTNPKIRYLAERVRVDI